MNNGVDESMSDPGKRVSGAMCWLRAVMGNVEFSTAGSYRDAAVVLA
ncbi:MAG: hypothetical protein GF363_13540, partial [Chitinivibrionales bacterium]|nr:hypothetical protein [Chitinivibrionales bacterium]